MNKKIEFKHNEIKKEKVVIISYLIKNKDNKINLSDVMKLEEEKWNKKQKFI